MGIKKILNGSIFLLLILNSYKLYAFDKGTILNLAEETLALNESNESNRNSEKIDKNLSDIKEIIQLEMKLGNPSAPIDIYLFLRGVVNDDIYSLQSLLSQSETQELPNDISKFINYSIAKKLALALKENRIAIKSNVIIKKPKEKSNCDLYVNGNLLKNISSFQTPTGVPIYVALYCNDNTFEIQKIRPGESQENQSILFNHFEERQNIPASIPNPNQVKLTSLKLNENMSELEQKNNFIASKKIENSEQRKFEFGTGVGYLKDFGTLSDNSVQNLKFSRGSFLYSNSYIKYKYFLISFDYSRVSLTEAQQITYTSPSLPTEISTVGDVYGKANFIRPGIGVRIPIFYLSDYFKIEADLLANTTIVKKENSSSYKMGYGIQSLVGPAFLMGSGFLFDLKLGMGYGFGKLSGFQLYTQMGLGYSF